MAALRWVKENLPGVLRLDKRAFADALAVTESGTAVKAGTGIKAGTGETLPFVTVTPAEDVFFVN